MQSLFFQLLVSGIKMIKMDLYFKIIELLLQLALVILAIKALSVWKSEIRGRDKYKTSKELLEYIKNIRFIIHSKEGSMYFIYLNDILYDRKRFYEDQIFFIAKEKIFFDKTYWYLFEHLNVRSDIFLPKETRIILETLYPSGSTILDKDKSKYSFIQIQCDNSSREKDFKDAEDAIYEFNVNKDITVEEFFNKWEKLIKELQKDI